MNVPQTHQDLLSDEKRAYAYLSTIMDDGTPQVTPVWFNLEGEHILINSQEGRVKDRNMRERPNVALLIMDPDDPYRYLMIRGPVVEITAENAFDHINQLAMKYTGESRFNVSPPDAVRLIYKIAPVKITAR
jgi:PPOX class probable F420-dependent enzyme